MLYNYGTCVVNFMQGRDWNYTTSSSTEVILTEYTGSSQNITVPTQIRI